VRFSEGDFQREHQAFHEAMGSKGVMEDLERRGLALKGFMWTVIHLEPGVFEKYRSFIEGGVDEFARRVELADGLLARRLLSEGEPDFITEALELCALLGIDAGVIEDEGLPTNGQKRVDVIAGVLKAATGGRYVELVQATEIEDV
jgi:hypothetical protein